MKFKMNEDVLIRAFGVLGTVEMIRSTEKNGGVYTEYYVEYTLDPVWGPSYDWFDEMELM